jgi:hypothetical protein
MIDAAGAGNLAKVTEELDKGVNINGLHCNDGCRQTALMMAAANGHLNVITLLMQRGADIWIKDSEKKTAMDIANAKGKTEAAERIRAMDEERSRDKVVFFTDIADRVREDVYDFTMKERLTLIRKSRFGEVESAIITGFSSIEDKSDSSLLRKAFNEHVKRGGTTEESAVFTEHIFKPRVSLPKN